MSFLDSKFPGSCKGCGASIAQGQRVFWSRETGALCLECRPEPDPLADSARPGDVELAGKLGFMEFTE